MVRTGPIEVMLRADLAERKILREQSEDVNCGNRWVRGIAGTCTDGVVWIGALKRTDPRNVYWAAVFEGARVMEEVNL